MTNTMREGLISLIFKGNGDREDLKIWRPISLLNNDYKILSKILVNRVLENAYMRLLIKIKHVGPKEMIYKIIF